MLFRCAVLIVLAWVCVASIFAQVTDDLPLDKLRLPTGFSVELVARIPNARQIALNGNETWLFAGTFNDGVVNALPITKDAQGKIVPRGPVRKIGASLTMPVGVAFDNTTGHLYVTQVGQIDRYDNIEFYLNSNRTVPPPRVMRVYPKDTWHGWKYIKIHNGRVYIPVGSPCNTCLRSEQIYGTLTSFNKTDGSDFKYHAQGIRNSVGFDWKNEDLYFTDNGRDEWGNDRPGDELNVIRASQLNSNVGIPHYGFPFCYEKTLNDPAYFNGSCANSQYIPAAYVLAPHAAALGMTFYRGSMFPQAYRTGNIAFIAEHGSWNRDTPIAYRVTMVDVSDPSRESYKVFIDGWLQLPKRDTNDSVYAWGRPVDVVVMHDGSLLISDDKAGAIYRVVYRN